MLPAHLKVRPFKTVRNRCRPGPAKKVTVYVMEGQKYHGMASMRRCSTTYFFRGISDATVTRGIAGFGTDHKLHTSRLVELADRCR